MILGEIFCDQITNIITMPIMITRVNDDDEKKSNLFGKHTIPGGQRTILIDAKLQLE